MSSQDDGHDQLSHDQGLTPAQLEELDRRLQDQRENPGQFLTWEEVRAELEGLGRQDPDPR